MVLTSRNSSHSEQDKEKFKITIMDPKTMCAYWYTVLYVASYFINKAIIKKAQPTIQWNSDDSILNAFVSLFPVLSSIICWIIFHDVFLKKK